MASVVPAKQQIEGAPKQVTGDSFIRLHLKKLSPYQSILPFEARWKQEERAKEEALIQINSQRKGREQIEASGRAKENEMREMRLKAETDVQRYKDNIKKLEKQIEQIEVRKRKEKNVDRVSELKFDQVPRHRECVMCVHDEVSVVFLPCTHQVLCEECSELQERLGVKLCPYCRTLIEKRIMVRDVNF